MTLEKLVKVKWIDATSAEVDINDISKNSKDYLTIRYSFGQILVEDKEGIVLINTCDSQGIEYTAIPRSWIKKIYRK